MSLKASETLEGSIESWIGENCDKDEQKEVYDMSVEVLGRIGDEA